MSTANDNNINVTSKHLFDQACDHVSSDTLSALHHARHKAYAVNREKRNNQRGAVLTAVHHFIPNNKMWWGASACAVVLIGMMIQLWLVQPTDQMGSLNSDDIAFYEWLGSPQSPDGDVF